MKTKIFYFSATGNSLMVARGLADKLQDAEVLPVAKKNGNQQTAAEDERMILVFPVCLWGLPIEMERFIGKLEQISPRTPIFGVATYKSQPGGVLWQLQNRLHKKGLTLAGGFLVQMPGNNIVYYDADSEEACRNIFSRCEQQMDDIAEKILKAPLKGAKQRPTAVEVIETAVLHPILCAGFPRLDKHFRTNSTCIGCGTCASVCPAGNILMENGKPVWQHHCEQCVACINLCPNNAIEYSSVTVGKKRYKNPSVALKDLMIGD